MKKTQLKYCLEKAGPFRCPLYLHGMRPFSSSYFHFIHGSKYFKIYELLKREDSSENSGIKATKDILFVLSLRVIVCASVPSGNLMLPLSGKINVLVKISLSLCGSVFHDFPAV